MARWIRADKSSPETKQENGSVIVHSVLVQDEEGIYHTAYKSVRGGKWIEDSTGDPINAVWWTEISGPPGPPTSEEAEQAKTILKALDRLDDVCHRRMLHEMRKLVNGIIKDYQESLS